ncbi:SOS response-associated peptidase [Paenibacillus sp. ACRRX]|uniref:SOS response-associated peptidase n=1 Tax=unclassified Paenibacillus TaxID=185978 RepID=UPI001EF706B3|nr:MULTISPECIES: SOS response-associated peptidase [unclassified Paenibacillus]MCG7408586.1 SOS response-associated peptidase [Paenibacillus sp. ACRRX]MDK8182833.1 SOS response-associated peptidase [Paenibacillus sp. UMB4589-SE434]
MCRQYSISASVVELQALFGIDQVNMNYRPRYNVIPTQEVPVVHLMDGQRILDKFRWGLVPFWAVDAVNADLLSVFENVAYRKVIERQRCIIPCTGFYYWRTTDKRKHPVRVVLRTNGTFGIAGLYDMWRNAKGDTYRTCTLLMAPRGNALTVEFDRRMPAILEPEEYTKWLEPESLEVEYFQRMLKPVHENRMHLYPVSPLIEHSSYDEEACIQEMDLKQAWVKN